MLIEKIKKENIDLHAKGLDYYIIYYFDRLEYGKGDLNLILIWKIFMKRSYLMKKCLHIYREDGFKV